MPHSVNQICKFANFKCRQRCLPSSKRRLPKQSVQVQDTQKYICCSHMSRLRFVNGPQVHVFGNGITPSSRCSSPSIYLFPLTSSVRRARFPDVHCRLCTDSQVQLQVYTFGNEITPAFHVRPLHIHVFTNSLCQASNKSGRALQVLLEGLQM